MPLHALIRGSAGCRSRIASTSVVFLVLTLLAGPARGGLLDDLARQVEGAVRQKAREVVECAADDEKCARKARKDGKEVRTVPATTNSPAAVAAAPATAAGQGGATPYSAHALSTHPAYQLANRLADAPSEDEVRAALQEAIERMNLGIYTHEGRRIVAGAERKPTDLFLYDFQVRIVAAAFHRRNVTNFVDHGRMLGAGMLNLKDPSAVPAALGRALERRYQQAVARPEDPMSFVVLLIDGLARRQAIPYSLDEAHRFEDRRIAVDPVQSTLIMLDFFTRPPAPRGAFNLDWLPSIVATANADGPCDAIKGDDEQGYWGRGTDILGEIGGELPGAIGKAFGVLGNATGVIGALGDLLALYGMSVHLQPQPVFIHLNHPGEDRIAAIEATVAFDAQGVPDKVLKCGWLAGKQMPSNGGMKDVELTWDFMPVLTPQLEVHSSMWDGWGDANDRSNHITATAGGFRTVTDEAGKSIFVLQPNTCPRTDGVIRDKNYMASANARYVSRGIPTPGLLGFGLVLKLGPGALELLTGGRTAYARFAAQWHEPKPPPPPY